MFFIALSFFLNDVTQFTNKITFTTTKWNVFLTILEQTAIDTFSKSQ